MKLWQSLSRKQKLTCFVTASVVAVGLLWLWIYSGFNASVHNVAESETGFGLNFIVEEEVGDDFLPGEGFIVVEPNCVDPKYPDETRLYMTQGRAYCLTPKIIDGATGLQSVVFASSRSNRFYELPISGDRSLSAFSLSESTTFFARIVSNGTVTVTSR